MQRRYFDCQCSDFNHVFRFVLDEQDGELHLEVQLDLYLPWYKRLWLATLYVLGRQRHGYGHYDITMLREEDYVQLHDMMDRSALIKRIRASQRSAEKPVLKG